jgi:hypothetical protein
MEKLAAAILLATCVSATAEETMLERAIRVEVERDANLKASFRYVDQTTQSIISNIQQHQTSKRIESIDKTLQNSLLLNAPFSEE